MTSGNTLVALLVLAALARSQDINLRGRVLDRAGLKPVAGAVVRLQSRPEAADTTGTDGRFSIVRAATVILPDPRPHPGQQVRPRLHLQTRPYFRPDPATAPGSQAEVPARDATGALNPGSWTFSFLRPRDLSPHQSGPAPGIPAAKSTSADGLDVSKPGLITRSVHVAEYDRDLGDIVLEYPPRKLGVGAPPIYGSIPLFDGTRQTLDAEWEHWMGTYRIRNNLGPTPITWTLLPDPVDDGLTMRTCCRYQWGDEDLVTRRRFRDFQVHLEFNLVSPPRTGTTAPGPANSGVYLQSLYEIQIKDDYGLEPLGDHDAGAILNEFAAPKNLGLPRGRWQAYDITFRAARFRDGKRVEKARLTMYWNGTLVHQDRETANEHNTGVSSDSLSDGPKGFKLQSEGHDVRFRNVWIKELDLAAPSTDVGY